MKISGECTICVSKDMKEWASSRQRVDSGQKDSMCIKSWGDGCLVQNMVVKSVRGQAVSEVSSPSYQGLRNYECIHIHLFKSNHWLIPVCFVFSFAFVALKIHPKGIAPLSYIPSVPFWDEVSLCCPTALKFSNHLFSLWPYHPEQMQFHLFSPLDS